MLSGGQRQYGTTAGADGTGVGVGVGMGVELSSAAGWRAAEMALLSGARAAGVVGKVRREEREREREGKCCPSVCQFICLPASV